MLIMSTEILLFRGKDYTSINKLGLINFVHNSKCSRIKTEEIRTMPIGYYADKGDK